MEIILSDADLLPKKWVNHIQETELIFQWKFKKKNPPENYVLKDAEADTTVFSSRWTNDVIPSCDSEDNRNDRFWRCFPEEEPRILPVRNKQSFYYFQKSNCLFALTKMKDESTDIRKSI